MTEEMFSDNIKIDSVNWQQGKMALSDIRRRVFIEEQSVPEALEWDEYDDTSTHFIVSLEEKAIATARLKADGQIGRMAVLAEYRNQGIGAKLLCHVLQVAKSENLEQVYLHAQTDAIPFYEKQGFKARGEIFYEANIPHRGMSKKTC